MMNIKKLKKHQIKFDTFELSKDEDKIIKLNSKKERTLEMKLQEVKSF